MKPKIILFVLAIATSVALTGCKSPEATAYKVDGTIITTVDAAMMAWRDYVLAGKATQTQVDTVKAAYRRYYDAELIFEQGVIAYKSAPDDSKLKLAQATVVAAEQPLIDLVKSFLPTK